MDDLISRQAAIDGILQLMPAKLRDDATPEEQINYVAWRCALGCAVSSVGTQPSAQPGSYMVTTAESMDLDRLKGIITKPSDITIIPLPKAEPGWIPVTEGLPELYKDVLVWYVDDYNIACLVQIDNIKYWHFESSEMDSNIDNVTAWMPLPEPWKGGRE